MGFPTGKGQDVYQNLVDIEVRQIVGGARCKRVLFVVTFSPQANPPFPFEEVYFHDPKD
jgi:hypothetical protein